MEDNEPKDEDDCDAMQAYGDCLSGCDCDMKVEDVEGAPSNAGPMGEMKIKDVLKSMELLASAGDCEPEGHC
jgi:hypothetical protein